MNILIADDHAIVRTGLRQILTDYSTFEVVGEAASGPEVLRSLERNHWDVVLLDLTLPGMNGLEVLQEIKRRWPEVAVLVLSMHSEDQYALRALKAGAAGYLTKGCKTEELLQALQQVGRGEKYITLSVAQKLARSFQEEEELAPHERLSDREFQIFCLLASGLRNAEISKRLSLSEKTISTHRNRILEKMGMKNFAELICYAVEHGFVDKPLSTANPRPNPRQADRPPSSSSSSGRGKKARDEDLDG